MNTEPKSEGEKVVADTAVIGGEQAWKWECWQAYCEGERNVSALARQFGHDWETCDRAVKRIAALVEAALENGKPARAQAIGSLEYLLQQALRKFRDETVNENAKASYLKQAADLTSQIAAVSGVVTERKGLDHSGKVALTQVPMPVFAEDDAMNHIEGGDDDSPPEEE